MIKINIKQVDTAYNRIVRSVPAYNHMQLKPPLFERVLRETDEDTDDFKKKLADLRKRVQRYRLTQYY